MIDPPRKPPSEGSGPAEAMLRAVFENVQDGLAIIDDQGRVLDANPAFEQVRGLREHFAGLWRQAREDGVSGGEYAFEQPGGEQRWVELTVRRDFLPGRHLAVARDCTERRQRIVAEALTAEDRARERISEQLHDELLQPLFVIRQDLAEIAQHPERSDLVARARDATQAAIETLRAAVSDIHPVVLERSGLRSAVAAVAQHHAGMGGFEIDVDFQPGADGEHARLLLSLVRELLTNVVRHADARHAAVRLWGAGEEVRLEVCDDGRGIDPDLARSALSRGHIGLASAVQRVEALGGRFDLAARPGGGTCVQVAVPLARRTA